MADRLAHSPIHLLQQFPSSLPRCPCIHVFPIQTRMGSMKSPRPSRSKSTSGLISRKRYFSLCDSDRLRRHRWIFNQIEPDLLTCLSYSRICELRQMAFPRWLAFSSSSTWDERSTQYRLCPNLRRLSSQSLNSYDLNPVDRCGNGNTATQPSTV
jgi:hypothetical protein